MDLKKITKAYFVGVGGIGVSALVRLFAHRGIEVIGSDVHLPPKESMPPGTYFEGENVEHVPHDAGVLIYSPAVPEGNKERERARELNISQLSYPEALAEVTRTFNTIAVSGTHGKSTTTALLGKLFEAGRLDPSVIVGAKVPGWDHNLRTGKSNTFIVEACEYRRHMLYLNPQSILLTNLELDHPDYYQDLADIKNAFHDYIEKLKGDGLLVLNNDDANLRDITRNYDGAIVRYGLGGGADLGVRNLKQTEVEQSFDLVWKETALGSFTTSLPGLYNVYNILAAIAMYLAHQGKVEIIQEVLTQFHGIGRRFETVGTLGKTKIISDYAHHPTALEAVVKATLAQNKDKRVLVVFRPHHRERTRKLFDQFVKVIAKIPYMILLEIYDVAGREEAENISSKDLITAVHVKNPVADILYAKDLSEGERLAREQASNFDVILVIGAGDADELAKRLIQ